LPTNCANRLEKIVGRSHMLHKDMKMKLKVGDSNTDLLYAKRSAEICYIPKHEHNAWLNSEKCRICHMV